MFGPSFSLGRLVGIPLRVHWTFSLLVLWIGAINLIAGGSLRTALGGVLFLLLLFVCVTLHELGHALAARSYGIRTRHITLSPIGGVAALDSMPRRWRQELWIALAGPAVNIAICLVLLPVLLVSPFTMADLLQPFSSVGGFAAKLFAANFLLAAFNLLPAFPMDGGRVLRALLAVGGNYARATHIAARSGQVFAAIFALVGIFYSPFLLLIAVFLFFAAEGELQAVKIHDSLRDWRVGDVMQRHCRSIPPDMPISEAAALALTTGQSAFPLVIGGRVFGILDRPGFVRARRQGASFAPVAEFATADFAIASVDDDLRPALELMSKSGQMALPVFREGTLVGMLNPSVAADLQDLPVLAGVVFRSSRPVPVLPRNFPRKGFPV